MLQARRERQNRISSLMGDYLLRGYRMLGDTCADCGVRTDSECESRDGAQTRPHGPSPASPLRPLLPGVSPPPLCFPTHRPSSSKTNSGRSTAWLVRSSTQTWIRTIRVRGCACRVEKRGDRTLGAAVLGGDSGGRGWDGGEALSLSSVRSIHSVGAMSIAVGQAQGGSQLQER